MDTKTRRNEILQMLQNNDKPASASYISERFNVSRQIIVGDVALLRAEGHDIMATSSGYILNSKPAESAGVDADTYILACNHDKSSLEAELYIIVDNGASIVNVAVDHPLYGTVTQALDIKSRFDADAFIKKVALTGGTLLCSLTAGAHLHTIRCADPEAYRRILKLLREKGIV